MPMPPRPIQHLRALEARYPEAWRQAARFRTLRGAGLPDWPAWCYLPLSGAYAIVSGGTAEPLSIAAAADIGRVGALAAWRETQGIYLYDETLLTALWETPVDGELPREVLEHLPEWCVYVQLAQPRPVGPGTLHGWYAHLEHDVRTGRRELRLVLDETLASGEDLLLPLSLHLVGDLPSAVRAFVAEAQCQAPAELRASIDDAALASSILGVEPLVSVLLYLCASASEILARGSGLAHPRLHGVASRRPKAPIAWDVGVRLGAALAVAEARAAADGVARGAHASPRGHVRRAHWHHYWTGPRDSPARRRLALRWLPPVGVNLDLGGIVPTVHEVL